MVIALVALLVAGRPIVEALLVAYGVQLVVFCVFIVMGRARAKEPVRAAPADAAPQRREAADIWRTYPSSVEAESPVRIALIAPDIGQSRRMATDLSQLGVEVHHGTDPDAMLETVQARPQDWGAVMVDLDRGAGLDVDVDDVLHFRAACPDIPVLILSNASLHADLPRRPIGDMTLQKPVLREDLAAGIDAMNLNFGAGQRDDANASTRSVAAISLDETARCGLSPVDAPAARITAHAGH
ncbi:hypothetical protein [Rhodobacteraceae bacterium W635]|uniref:hypothetical protein n=1 Tax=Nioella halotolerans TaxID=2303578 RepID=UPI000E3CAAAF